MGVVGGDVSRWDELVDRAKARIVTINKRRMEVAALALEACEIVHGGGAHWSGHEGVRTLRKFAADVGMPYKTLHRWCSLYKGVWSKVPEGLRDERNHGAIERTLSRVGTKADPAKVLRVYSEEKGRAGSKHRGWVAVKDLRCIANRLGTKMDLRECKTEDLARMRDYGEEIVKKVKMELARRSK